MKHLLRGLPLLLVLGTLTVVPTLAQPPPGAPQPQNMSPPPAPARPQPVVVQAGTGMLLPLPAPASTVMSADPGVARVQPASPTSLFLMGVAQGHTTVIAASEAGTAIVQYRCDGDRRRRWHTDADHGAGHRTSRRRPDPANG